VRGEKVICPCKQSAYRMRICIPSPYPGGPPTPVTATFEEAAMLDYYEVEQDGSYSQIAQTRNCIGACIDPVEAIMRRGVERVVVRSIGPSYLMRFRNAGVRVFLANSEEVDELIKSIAKDELKEMKKSEI